MKALIQRVISASVTVEHQIIGSIQHGIVVFLGVERSDDKLQAETLAKRIINYRVFNDELDKMNLSLLNIQGELLVISQFTLAADTSHGRRPSFSNAATHGQAETLYEDFIQCCQQHGVATQTGRFGADMNVHLINDGPVTFNLNCDPS